MNGNGLATSVTLKNGNGVGIEKGMNANTRRKYRKRKSTFKEIRMFLSY